MVPDTVLRLAAIRKALEDIIRPVLPDDASFAQEQLGLIIKSLALAGKQIPHEYAFRVRDAHAFADFGRDVIAALPEGDAGRAAIGQAIEAVEAVAPRDVPDRPELEARLHTLRAAIEQAVEQGAGSRKGLDDLWPVALAHTERQTLLERLWVVDTGFDIAPGELPTLEAALYGANGDRS